MKILLLNSAFEPLNFINLRRAIRLYMNDKVDAISFWDSKIRTAEKELDFPSVLRLRKYYKIPFARGKFNRKAVFRRDLYVCQYCQEQVTAGSATLDHIIPSARGGVNSWLNCVTACKPCNIKKRDRTPEEAGMALITAPIIPNKIITIDYILEKPKHPDWQGYFGI
jgi:5-methylcytosine-specific restriction endonuclease McrA